MASHFSVVNIVIAVLLISNPVKCLSGSQRFLFFVFEGIYPYFHHMWLEKGGGPEGVRKSVDSTQFLPKLYILDP